MEILSGGIMGRLKSFTGSRRDVYLLGTLGIKGTTGLLAVLNGNRLNEATERRPAERARLNASYLTKPGDETQRDEGGGPK